MICYMPFTEIDAALLDKLTVSLGPVTIYCPEPGTVSDHMLAAAREKRLELKCGHGVSTDHLARAAQEFKAWAELHGGEIADLAGLSKSMQGSPPLVDETNPTHIGNQIRHFGEQSTREAADPVFQAALFLSMAGQFDRQQLAVARELGQVQAMERSMLARLAGGGDDPEESIGAAPDVAAGISDIGGFMTARRVRSWAELASRDAGSRSFILYVTSSPAVLEHLLDHFEQARGPLGILLGAERTETGSPNRKTIEALECLAMAKDPAVVSADCFKADGNGAQPADLTLYTLAGISPLDFPCRLLADRKRTQPGAPGGKGALNTLIGLVEK